MARNALPLLRRRDVDEQHVVEARREIVGDRACAARREHAPCDAHFEASFHARAHALQRRARRDEAAAFEQHSRIDPFLSCARELRTHVGLDERIDAEIPEGAP